MIWRRWGLKDNPYALKEIDETTLDLFVGRNSEIKSLQNALTGNKRIIFLEGDEGVGKTSVGNFWRYSSMQKRLCFTPYAEICADQPLKFYPLILKVLEVLNWSLPQNHPFISRDPEFKAYEKKYKELLEQVSSHLSDEAFNDDWFSSEIKQLFRILAQITSKLSYEYGTLIQISFTGCSAQAKTYFQREFWDLSGVEGFRWLLIGEPMLQEQLYHHLSEIVPDDLMKISVGPLEPPQVHELFMRRKDYLALTQSARLPLAAEVIDHLHLLSGGNLNKTNLICKKIIELQRDYQTTVEINLMTAKPLITQHFQDEIRQRLKLTPGSAEILNFLVKEEGVSPGVIAERMQKLRPNVSKNLMYLRQTNLVRMEVKGRYRVYYPSMEAKLAFS